MKNKKINKEQLILPVYLNEKTVLDMLAITEDGFAMVSEVSSSYQDSSEKRTSGNAGFSTTSLLNKFLKIDLSGESSANEKNQQDDTINHQKVHTNSSLFSKFRLTLIENDLLLQSSSDTFDFSNIQFGDFVEIQGTLQKNPLIETLERFHDIFRVSELFSEVPALGEKKKTKNNNQEQKKIERQISSLLEELTVSGTVDFILKNADSTFVLSAQEQYLTNDNISELIGGEFKVLGKVIKVTTESDNSINLLRKTVLNSLDDDSLKEIQDSFAKSGLENYNFPPIVTTIKHPAAIIIPIAIYA